MFCMQKANTHTQSENIVDVIVVVLFVATEGQLTVFDNFFGCFTAQSMESFIFVFFFTTKQSPANLSQ